ncbi:helix-turn-helix domain-containing protein [Methylobacterium phyllosphaerae]
MHHHDPQQLKTDRSLKASPSVSHLYASDREKVAYRERSATTFPASSIAGSASANRDGTIREWVGMCLAIIGSKRFQVDGLSTAHQRERITAGQVRAARAMLGWSIGDLSAKTDLSPSTIARIEDEARSQSVRSSNLNAARTAFEANGITFTWSAIGEAGLYLRFRPKT